MQQRSLMCEIVTPECILYRSEVHMVVAPTEAGEIGILPLHAPLFTLLAPGEVRVRFENEVEWFAISGGYMQVHEDKVIILADDAFVASQIDVSRAEQAKQNTAERLKELKAVEGEEIDRLERDLKWCEAQLTVAAKSE